VGCGWTKKQTTYYYNNILNDNNRKNTINNTIFYSFIHKWQTIYVCLIIIREMADEYPKRVRYVVQVNYFPFYIDPWLDIETIIQAL